MNHEPTSTALTGSAWIKAAEFTENPPKSVFIKNLATSGAVAKVLVKPNHIAADPTDQDGFTLEVGERVSIAKMVRGGGDGLIEEVWAKSSGATVEVGEDA